LGITDDNPVMVPTLMLVWYEFFIIRVAFCLIQLVDIGRRWH
jgi:hypothetical protein